ncbi:hypothetical protein QJS66_00670 [Kocuria rhizophila]|nr:hypothetical protein QJS66_00670 [Kocuria rhizophila]
MGNVIDPHADGGGDGWTSRGSSCCARCLSARTGTTRTTPLPGGSTRTWPTTGNLAQRSLSMVARTSVGRFPSPVSSRPRTSRCSSRPRTWWPTTGRPSTRSPSTAGGVCAGA